MDLATAVTCISYNHITSPASMSVEATKPVEETPVVEPTTTKPLPEHPEHSVAPVDAPAAAPMETTEATPAAIEQPAGAIIPEEPKKDETVVEAIPASEGVLGYKEPKLFKYVLICLGCFSSVWH